jgi:apolipoprotein N-acyltransferase
MKEKKIISLSLLSGLLFSIAWPPVGYPILLFVAFIPLLFMEDALLTQKILSGRLKLFFYSYLTFLIWNSSSTYWVCNASPAGGIAAIVLNSLLMAVVFSLFHATKTKLLSFSISQKTTYVIFPLFWVGYEYFHHRWDVSWPWLALGNAFAGNHTWIQWYEYTGVPGGSVWVLVVNVLLFRILKEKKWRSKETLLLSAKTVCIIIAPIIGSLYLYAACAPKKNTLNEIEVVVVQPNIDPFSEKFSGMNFQEQLHKMLCLASEKVDSTTDYVVFPETALTESMWENTIKQTASIGVLKGFLQAYPKLKIIAGAATDYAYEKNEKRSATARKFKQEEGYYDSYNTALQIDHSDSIQIYHKSKLVPGVERMPYPAIFGFLENLSIDLGGTAGSLGTQEERSVFKAPSNSLKRGEQEGVSKPSIAWLTGVGIAPVICYESIYGEYVTDYINQGASALFIITNDGWWRNTPGYEQHLLYGRLRAIETRRCIARSANTGISCFINERGDFSQETSWWKPAVIKQCITLHSEKTFYVQHGEIIGTFCFYAWMLLSLATLLLRGAKR